MILIIGMSLSAKNASAHLMANANSILNSYLLMSNLRGAKISRQLSASKPDGPEPPFLFIAAVLIKASEMVSNTTS